MSDMNDDRTLLELAAKAAGIKLAPTGFVWDDETAEMIQWNPLADDADAFSLLVTIGAAKGLTLDIGPGGSCVTVNHPFCDADEFQTPGKPHDPRAATRRAIVRAAAKLVQEKAP